MWRTISPPFVPTAHDIQLVQRACPPELLKESAAPRILVLGVTPALISARWPASSEVHAVDYDQVMIDALWEPKPGAHCHCAWWQDMPFADDEFDLVIGDCSFNALPGIDAYDEVLREILRVSRPSAPLVCRFFMQQEPRLTLAELTRESSGKFAGYGSSARRLLIPIAASEEDGRLHSSDIPGRIREQVGDIDEFLEGLGQSPEEQVRAKRTFEFDQRLNYPDRQTIGRVFGQYFKEIEFAFPDYDCGAFCPIVSFSGRDG